MRRNDHPSRPSAMTCCFFASFKTFPTGRRVSPYARVNVLLSGLPLAGFEVATYGRFWVAAEENDMEVCRRDNAQHVAWHHHGKEGAGHVALRHFLRNCV